MMIVANFKIQILKKRYPLTISRGTRSESENLFVEIVKEGISGFGEMAPVELKSANSPEEGKEQIRVFLSSLPENTSIEKTSIENTYDAARQAGLPLSVIAALDIALWDWLGKKNKLPLYKLIGAGLPVVPTSITIGISSPASIKDRILRLLESSKDRPLNLKLKLGSPEGIEFDKHMFSQISTYSKNHDIKIRVDANGGWSVPDALHMMNWLSKLGVEYIEQPLKQGEEGDLPYLFKNRSLPIYVDESCQVPEDVGKCAHCVDGVNIKLMKCGGITGALRILQLAKKYELKTMIGCMSESSLSISAGAAISGFVDHIDLDSHLNLNPDPCIGATLIDGIVMPTDLPGHGARLTSDSVR